jgi:Flp pilus assembly protein TadG
MLRRDKGMRRRGSVLPLVAVCLTALMAMIALGVDLGLLAVARTQCQNAADLAALAGTRELNGNIADNNRPAAQTFAVTAATNNSVLSVPLVASQVAYTTGVYRYNSTSQMFAADFSGTKGATESWTAMQITVQTQQPTYFARVFNLGPIAVSATAVAVHRPRDVAIALDFSTSMQYGSNVNIRGVNESSSDPTAGSMNPDPNYPQFGPWSIFQASSVSSGNPNPMMNLDAYGDLHGESHAPSNLTIATTNGPPLVGDFLCDTTGGGNYVNAFVCNTTGTYSATLTPTVTPTTTSTTWLAAPVDGDPWPLTLTAIKAGKTSAASPSDYAGCVKDYLGKSFTSSTNAIDNGFKTNGYDYNYNTNTKKWQTTSGLFKGYTVGPGYYGKTFYMWPPDPRSQFDWRQKYFFKSDGTTPVTDNTVLWNGSGNWIQNGGVINYANVLAWLTSGPQTLPANLQSGHIVYYSSIPTSVSSYTSNLDQRFWKEYIDFVLGYNSETTTYNTINSLYGVNSSGSPSNQPNGGNGFGSFTFGPTPAITSPPSNGAYMSYTDAPVHPRLHFWFGPLTMMAFLVGRPEYARNWNPGTSHEAHDWQLKAGIQSAIQDLKNNHPNDQASLIYFATNSAYNTARVPMGQNYTYLTNALWYPYSLINPSDGSVSGTIRPYNTSFNDTTQGIVPTANGGTDSSAGLAVAYNQFSSNTGQGFTGRRGAVKMVILETDGVTHDWFDYNMQQAGAWNSYFTFGSGHDESVNSTLTSPSKQATYTVAKQLTALTTDNVNGPGYSTARQPARIHCMAFGQLIEPSMTNDATAGPMQKCVLEFLLQIQQSGNTSPSTDTIESCWGYPGTATSGGDGITPASGGYTTGTQSFKIIVGGYQQRINLIQQAMSRIMQSGVQISLIQ